MQSPHHGALTWVFCTKPTGGVAEAGGCLQSVLIRARGSLHTFCLLQHVLIPKTTNKKNQYDFSYTQKTDYKSKIETRRPIQSRNQASSILKAKIVLI